MGEGGGGLVVSEWTEHILIVKSEVGKLNVCGTLCYLHYIEGVKVRLRSGNNS